MNAIISGQAGVAMVLDGDEVAALRVGSGESASTCRLEDFAFLFGDADDLLFLDDVEIPQVAERLTHEFEKELALQLTLVLLDHGLSPRTRRVAGEELEVLFSRESTKSFVEGVLYARILPFGSDLTGAHSCIPGNATRVNILLQELAANQSHIAAVQMAWEVIPADLFGGSMERSQIHAAAVRAGWFREIVTWRSRGAKGRPPLASLDSPLTIPPDVIAAWIEELRRESAGLDEPEEGKSPDESTLHLSFVAEDTADLEVAINLAYKSLRELRAKVALEPGLALMKEQRLRELRMLQKLESQEIARLHKTATSLPRGAWEALAQAERLLSG
jgi:hypothetical protein